jgi:hypothetical protein
VTVHCRSGLLLEQPQRLRPPDGGGKWHDPAVNNGGLQITQTGERTMELYYGPPDGTSSRPQSSMETGTTTRPFFFYFYFYDCFFPTQS